MQPATPDYLAFLSLIIMIYWLSRNNSWRKWILLTASFTFYAIFDMRFFLLLLVFIGITYWLGQLIGKSKHSRVFLIASIGVSLALLCYFKYSNFFIDSLYLLVNRLGIPSFERNISILLPVGISFYSFQAISYALSVFRKKINPTVTILDYALYLAFFPKIIAGPFVKPDDFLAQMNSRKKLSHDEIKNSLLLLLLGLVKKVIIADGFAGQADVAFRAAAISAADSTSRFVTPLFIQGFYLYAIQIYADFSGYTDIARGAAALFGLRLPENFRQPYLSASITDFWDRWHMSLTAWFREYLFFPISRKLLKKDHGRHPRLVQTIANLITMLLIGLWHGAAWTYITWGAWHGILLSFEKYFRIRSGGKIPKIVAGIIIFHLVAVGWVIFHSSSIPAAGAFMAGLFSFYQMRWMGFYLPSILIPAALILGIDFGEQIWMIVRNNRFHFLGRTGVIASIFVIVFLFILHYARGDSANPFIYGQF